MMYVLVSSIAYSLLIIVVEGNSATKGVPILKYIAGLLILVGGVLVLSSGALDFSRGMEGLWNPSPTSSALHWWGFSILGAGAVFAILSVLNREH